MVKILGLDIIAFRVQSNNLTCLALHDRFALWGLTRLTHAFVAGAFDSGDCLCSSHARGQRCTLQLGCVIGSDFPASYQLRYLHGFPVQGLVAVALWRVSDNLQSAS
jgi:hypothetical protein